LEAAVLGGTGLFDGATGGDSTLVIGGVTLTALGGVGGLHGGSSVPPTLTASPVAQTFTTGVDYQELALGDPGFGLSISTLSVLGGNGGGGDYGVGGFGGLNNNGFAPVNGNGGGGGGASNAPNNPAATGGDGADGIWIIEEYS
jgi:hypothetical protein